MSLKSDLQELASPRHAQKLTPFTPPVISGKESALVWPDNLGVAGNNGADTYSASDVGIELVPDIARPQQCALPENRPPQDYKPKFQILGLVDGFNECGVVLRGQYVVPRGGEDEGVGQRTPPQFWRTIRRRRARTGEWDFGTSVVPVEPLGPFASPTADKNQVIEGRRRSDYHRPNDREYHSVEVFNTEQSYVFDASAPSAECSIDLKGTYTLSVSGAREWLLTRTRVTRTGSVAMLTDADQTITIENKCDVCCDVLDKSIRIKRRSRDDMLDVKHQRTILPSGRKANWYHFSVDVLGRSRPTVLPDGVVSTSRATNINLEDILSIGEMTLDICPIVADTRRPIDKLYYNIHENGSILAPVPINKCIYVNAVSKLNRTIITVFFRRIYISESMSYWHRGQRASIIDWVGVSVSIHSDGTHRLIPLDPDCLDEFDGRHYFASEIYSARGEPHEEPRIVDGADFFNSDGSLKPESVWPLPPVPDLDSYRDHSWNNDRWDEA